MKNKIHYLFLCLCLVCTAPFLTSCSDDDSESSPIVGEWADDRNANMFFQHFWKFDSKGNVELVVYKNPSFNPGYDMSGTATGKYTLKDGVLTINFTDVGTTGHVRSSLYFVTLTKDHMVWTDKDLDTISLTRK